MSYRHKHWYWWLAAPVVASAAVVGAVATSGGSHPSPFVSPAPAPSCVAPVNQPHLYHPNRFVFLGCQTVTGVAEISRTEPDGDFHVLLKLDPQYGHLLNAKNVSAQHGDLVIEEPCQHSASQLDAVAFCNGYRSPFSPLVVGKRYEISGAWVTDTDHSWNELHGLSSVTAL